MHLMTKEGKIMKKTALSNNDFIDPVCSMKVAPGNRNHSVTYKLHTYYFCTDFCRETFAANPEKFLAASAGRRKNWWRRYLDRLDRATGGQKPCCH